MKAYDRVRTKVDGLGAWNTPEVKSAFDVKLDAGETGIVLKDYPASDPNDSSPWWLAVFRAPAGTDAAVYALVAQDTLEVFRHGKWVTE